MAVRLASDFATTYDSITDLNSAAEPICLFVDCSAFESSLNWGSTKEIEMA